MLTRRAALALGGAAVLAGCGSLDTRPDASAEAVARAAYAHPGPPELTLFTMVNNRNGAGAHSSLMINASQRIILDPAGSVRFRSVPERKDVLAGITPPVEAAYISAHARESHRVRIQRLDVSPQVAEQALRTAFVSGPVPAANCARAVSSLLRGLPGFGSIGVTFFPRTLAGQFAAFPLKEDRVVREDDSPDILSGIARMDARLAQSG